MVVEGFGGEGELHGNVETWKHREHAPDAERCAVFPRIAWPARYRREKAGRRGRRAFLDGRNVETGRCRTSF